MHYLRFLLRLIAAGVLPAVLVVVLGEAVLDFRSQERERTARERLESDLRDMQRMATTDQPKIDLCQQVVDQLLVGPLDDLHVTKVRETVAESHPGLFQLVVYGSDGRLARGDVRYSRSMKPLAWEHHKYKFLWQYFADYLSTRCQWKKGRMEDVEASPKYTMLRDQLLGRMAEPGSVFERRGEMIPVRIDDRDCELFWDVITSERRMLLNYKERKADWLGLACVLLDKEIAAKTFGIRSLAPGTRGKLGSRLDWRPAEELGGLLKDWGVENPGDVRVSRRLICHFQTTRGIFALLMLPLEGTPVLFSGLEREDFDPGSGQISLWVRLAASGWVLLAGFILALMASGRYQPWISVRLRLAFTFLLAAMLPATLLILGGLRWLSSEDLAARTRMLQELTTRTRAIDEAALGLRDELQRHCSLFLDGPTTRSVADWCRAGKPTDEVALKSIFDSLTREAVNRRNEMMLQDFLLLDERGRELTVLPREADSSANQNREFLRTQLLAPISALLCHKLNGRSMTNEEPSLRNQVFGEVVAKASHKGMKIDFFSVRRKIQTLNLFEQKYILYIEPVRGGENLANAVLVLFFSEKDMAGRVLREATENQGTDGVRLYAGVGKRTEKSFPSDQAFTPVLRDYLLRIKESGRELQDVLLENGERLQAWGAPCVELEGYAAFAVAPLSSLQEASWKRQQLMMLILMIGLIFATGLGWQLSRGFIAPVAEMDASIRQVAAGDLSSRMAICSRDEFGDLAGTFNTMVAGLQEKERMSRYVSDFVREEVAKTDDGEGPASRRVEATILFADIRDFTTLSENHDAEVIVTMLNEYLSRMARVIREHGGVVDKFIGDAVMAVFHGQDELAGHPERAVRCALAMRDALARFNEERVQNNLFTVENGVGVHTGEVILGSIGAREERMDLTVIGDPVNVAARLEAMSKLGTHTRVILSEPTFRTVAHFIDAVLMSETRVKGKSGDVAMYEVVREKGMGHGA